MSQSCLHPPPPLVDAVFRRRSADVGGLQLALRGQCQGQGWLDATAWDTHFACVDLISALVLQFLSVLVGGV